MYTVRRELWRGEIWRIVFQIAVDEIKFGESISGARLKLYNCFTNVHPAQYLYLHAYTFKIDIAMTTCAHALHGCSIKF